MTPERTPMEKDYKKYRVTLVVDMDIDAPDPETAFEFVHHIATRDNDFTVTESFDPVLVTDDNA